MCALQTSLLWLCLATTALGQQGGVYLAKYIPGNYLANNVHELELGNEGTRPVAIGGWYVVTRNYSVRIPMGTVLAPGARYRMAKQPEGHARLNLVLSRAQDFLIRLPDPRYEGNYVALLNPQRQPVQGFYHSPQASPAFLPDSGQFLLDGKRMLDFRVPGPGSPLWTYFPLGDDPAVGFERVMGSWRVISATRPLNLYPAAAFMDLKARYQGGTVTLRWNTAFEDRLAQIALLRSTDGTRFEEIATLAPAAGNSNALHAYVYPDSELPPAPDSVLFYKLVARDVQGQPTESAVLQVLAREQPIAFWLEADPPRTNSSLGVGIRFYTATTQQVHILLLDQRGDYVALLFDGLAYADTQRLLRLQLDLPPGTYWVLAGTESRQFWQKFVVNLPIK